MCKRQFLNFNEGDSIYVFSGGKLEGQGKYVCFVEDKNVSFLCWRKHNGNEVYTNLNGISVETMNVNTTYLENKKETCERGYVDYQYTNKMYDHVDNDEYQQEYIDYDSNEDGTYYPNANDSYNAGYENNYKQNYDNICNANTSSTYNQSYNNYDTNSDTYHQSSENYNQNSGGTSDDKYYPNTSVCYDQS